MYRRLSSSLATRSSNFPANSASSGVPLWISQRLRIQIRARSGTSSTRTRSNSTSSSLATQLIHRTTTRTGTRNLSNNLRQYHNRRNKSTTTLDFVHSSGGTGTATSAVRSAAATDSTHVEAFPSSRSISAPSLASLQALFVASAIPMLGFGFMDNFVMIQAGQYIDNTLGVQFGLATMTAAAAGQVVSDVSGVLFGGSLERLLTRLGLVPKISGAQALTTAQRQLPISRNVSMAGAVVGVMVGCALGATTLLLVDVHARERLEQSQKLTELVAALVQADPSLQQQQSQTSASSAWQVTMYAPYTAQNGRPIFQDYDDGDARLRSLDSDASGSTGTSSVRQCAATKAAVSYSDREGRHCILVPVMGGDATNHDVLAVMELKGSTAAGSSTGNIDGMSDDVNDDEEAVQAATQLAKHVGIVMAQLFPR